MSTIETPAAAAELPNLDKLNIQEFQTTPLESTSTTNAPSSSPSSGPDSTAITSSTPPSTEPDNATLSPEELLETTTPSGKPFRSRHGPSADPKTTPPFVFGQRLLSAEDDVFDYNAWDHVETDDAYKEYMKEQIEKQKEKPVSEFDRKRFNANPGKFWNTFYTNNSNNFFKDRKWLGQEFPILKTSTAEGAPPTRVLEIGAGAGNTLFPILSQNKSKNFHITGVDFSAKSIEVIKSQEEFIKNHPTHISASVWDLGNEEGQLPEGVEPHSIDIVIMIFVFSALAPWQWRNAVRNVKKMLKVGGTLCFRDYGRGDLAQVRMKGSRWLGENFYVRGDGTRVYFFEEEELKDIFEGRWAALALEKWEATEGAEGAAPEEEQPRPEEEGGLKVTNIGADRRMLVNRKRQLKMYRCWMQMTCVKI